MDNISKLVKDEFSAPEFNPDAVFPIIASAFNMSVEYDCCKEHKKCLPRLPGNPMGIRSIKFIQHTNTPDWVIFKSYYQKKRPQPRKAANKSIFQKTVSVIPRVTESEGRLIRTFPSNDLKISAGADDRPSRSENEAILLSSGSLRLGHEGMRGYLARWDGEVSASPGTLKYLGFQLCPTAPFGNCFYEASAGQIHEENAVSLRVLMHKAALRLIESPTRAMNNDLLIFDREWLQDQVEGKYIIRHVPYNPDRTECSLAFWATLKHVPLLAYAVRKTVIVYGYQQCDHYASVASIGYGEDGNNRDLENISPEEDVIYLVCKDVGEGGHYDGLRRIKNEKEEVS